MTVDSIPIAVIFAATVVLVLLAIEAGFRLGDMAHCRSVDEKESPASAMAGSMLGLSAFILAFTFGIVAERYDAKRALVRDEANAIGTAFLRADFLQEPERTAAKRLYREYLDLRLDFAKTGSLDKGHVEKVMAETKRIQSDLWEMAVTDARKDMNSDVLALYIESVNQVIDIHAQRIAVGMQARVPAGIWMMLYALTLLGMMGVGYQTGIAGSKRSMARPMMAVAFALVFALIASLDRPDSALIKVSQQSLIDLRDSMGGAVGGAGKGIQAQ